MGNLILLCHIADRLEWLELACTRCERRGRLRVARLLRGYGPDRPIREVMDEMAADCPRRINPPGSLQERCSVFSPNLAGAFQRP